MAHLPKNVRDADIIASLKDSLIHQGKVRDTYQVPYDDDWALLAVATNRLSIFDFVLPVTVPKKGEYLTALTHFWMKKILKAFPNHLLDAQINPFQRNHAFQIAAVCPDLPVKRSLAFRKLNMLPYELIFRHHIGGSVWKEYLEKGTAGGEKLPPGLKKWAKLDKPVFTPSTKAESGHDVNITAEEFFKRTGKTGRDAVDLLESAYTIAYIWAESNGIRILDTKFEIGLTHSGELAIGDEILTPDSSRFTTNDDYEAAMDENRDPVFFDKEPVRAYGRKLKTPFAKNGAEVLGINNLDPENPEHLAFVDSIIVPDAVIADMIGRYDFIFRALTGSELPEYQKTHLL